ncbi:hypothetical protein TREMEDRAFT_63139 [Tremella mesenterica DSM 1558]|uniref:uncharacterized protein n=1 Tax=Tremella mesenterica (strain ATCC 24925 / CBS 8224 / DSM 1558 / NBRC 9311 / NRRL Y-6157 / RJB 2259-6 / UBC 559-6) TaxID=578456 RepID=UPI0003F48D64|nr:uncharacterized protein TREMEDRAFT_63139 [Tremella mesenterica DSM 1558]EIW68675.1 hypothetical protein TREMEDRAFT_63139 [Tremella mesenterica DSM 1558]
MKMIGESGTLRKVADFFKLGLDACPRPGAKKRDDLQRLAEEITLQSIVSGQTLSPVGKSDLTKWLDHLGEGGREGRMIYNFLCAVEDYKTSYDQLSPEDKSSIPTVFETISSLSLSNPEILKPTHIPKPSLFSLTSLVKSETTSPTLVSSYSISMNSDELFTGKPTKLPSEITSSTEEITGLNSFIFDLPRTIVRPSPLVLADEGRTNDRMILSPQGSKMSSLQKGKIGNRTVPSVPMSAVTGSSFTLGSMSSRGRRGGPALASDFRLPPSRHNEDNEKKQKEANEMSDDEDWDSSSPRSKLTTGLGPRIPPKAVVSPSRQTRLNREDISPINSSPTTRSFLSGTTLAPTVITTALHNVTDGHQESKEKDNLVTSLAGEDVSVENLKKDLPLHSELQSLLQQLIPLQHLITEEILDNLHLYSAHTTHPTLFDPLLPSLITHFSSDNLPRFLQASIKNLHRHTALGRLLVGISTSVVSFLATIFLLLDPSPFTLWESEISRPWRLLLIPVLLGGIGYGLGARAGMCFWLALFGVTEDPYDYQELERLNSHASQPEGRSSRWWGMGNSGRPRRKLQKRGSKSRSDSYPLSVIAGGRDRLETGGFEKFRIPY